MDIKITNEGNVSILTLNGQLNTMTSTQLQDSLMPLAESGDREILLDFQGLDYVSSAGLRVLLAAQNEVDERDIKMSICHVCEEVAEVFEMTGFDEILTIRE